jgi:hypothetical protein
LLRATPANRRTRSGDGTLMESVEIDGEYLGMKGYFSIILKLGQGYAIIGILFPTNKGADYEIYL